MKLRREVATLAVWRICTNTGALEEVTNAVKKERSVIPCSTHHY